MPETPQRPSYILSRCPRRRSRDGGTSETGFPAWLPHEFASSLLQVMNDEAVNVLSTLIAALLPLSTSRGVHHICQEAGRGRQFHGGDSGTSCSRSRRRLLHKLLNFNFRIMCRNHGGEGEGRWAGSRRRGWDSIKSCRVELHCACSSWRVSQRLGLSLSSSRRRRRRSHLSAAAAARQLWPFRKPRSILAINYG